MARRSNAHSYADSYSYRDTDTYAHSDRNPRPDAHSGAWCNGQRNSGESER